MATKLCTHMPFDWEHTLCGDAYDLDEDDLPEPTFAKPGQRITCPKCLAIIAEIKKIKNNVQN